MSLVHSEFYAQLVAAGVQEKIAEVAASCDPSDKHGIEMRGLLAAVVAAVVPLRQQIAEVKATLEKVQRQLGDQAPG